jgi:hypothetical protein
MNHQLKCAWDHILSLSWNPRQEVSDLVTNGRMLCQLLKFNNIITLTSQLSSHSTQGVQCRHYLGKWRSAVQGLIQGSRSATSKAVSCLVMGIWITQDPNIVSELGESWLTTLLGWLKVPTRL